MTVAEFIEYLKDQPQDLQVAHQMYGQHVLLDVSDIEIKKLAEPQADGWIPNKRPDMPTKQYLLLPGN